MHILLPETDNCPSWISGRERMTVENISWSVSTKECCRPRRGLNPRPPGLQSDGAFNWATKAGLTVKIKQWITFCHGWRCEKHYSKPRKRSEGKRPVQQYFATGCCLAILRLHLDSNGEKYKVTELIFDHNHPISALTLPVYFKNRTLMADEIMK